MQNAKGTVTPVLSPRINSSVLLLRNKSVFTSPSYYGHQEILIEKKNHIEVQCELRGNQKYQFKV